MLSEYRKVVKMEIKLLTVNPYSRPGTKLKQVKNIVVHWVGNAGSSAMANRNYFDSLKEKKSFASSHYIVGLQGEIIQCVPEGEIAYHANNANAYSIGIEVCHPDWQGKFTETTYRSLIGLLVDLCKRYGLEPTTAIIRHYDVTKKLCPKYYVENQQAWKQLKLDVADAMVVDRDLIAAVAKIISKGVMINATSWNNLNKIVLKNVPALLAKLGGLDEIKSKIEAAGMEFDIALWKSGKYTSSTVRSLLIKYAKSLS